MSDRNRLIQLIHVGQRELALDDDTYRALLFANGEHSSCSKMNIKQLENVLAVMEMQGFKRKGKGAQSSFKRRLSPKSGKAKHAQIDKIRAVWITMHQHDIVRDRSETALDAYIRRMTSRGGQKGVDHVGWLDSNQAYSVLESLKNWHKRELADRIKEAGWMVPMNRNGTGLAGYQAVVDGYEFMVAKQKAEMMKQLKELIERAILVAYWRNGDVDIEDGTYATTETDEMIHLEVAIQELFGLEAHELYPSLNSGQIIENKLNEIKAEAVMGFANSMVGAYETGFVEDHESNLADVYQCAKAHVELNYKTKVPAIDEAWGKDVANWCKNGCLVDGEQELIEIGTELKSDGLYHKYLVQKADGSALAPGFDAFVLRLDDGGGTEHVAACRTAVLKYADEIEPHLPLLAKDIRSRYSSAN